jgi:hypothetical protein
MRMIPSLALGACVLAMLTTAVPADEPPSPEPTPEVAQLDVVEMTAVELDGRQADGPEPVAYQWKIVEGEGGKLFSTDQEVAVFLAPKFERGVDSFVVELIVTFSDQPPSIQRARIRVTPTDPDAALDDEGEDDTQWLTDHYRRAREAQAAKDSQSPPIIVGGGSTGSSVSIGVAGGSGGYRGGIGFRYQMSYPVSKPAVVPPPANTETEPAREPEKD